MIECNNVIPKIITLTNTDDPKEVIDHYAVKNNIAPLYIIRVEPEKTELTVEQIHLFQKDIQVSFSHPLLIVLQDIDASSNEVQNALLKSLEEESDRIQFVLLVRTPSLLLPTIRSRCALIDEKTAVMRNTMERDSKEVFSFAHNSTSTKETALLTIDQFISSRAPCTPALLRYILTMRKLITDNNVNPSMALDSILIFIAKTSTIKKTHEK